MSFFDEYDDDESLYRPPPHQDDRIWRHPSEAAALARAEVELARSEVPTGGRSGAFAFAGTAFAGLLIAGGFQLSALAPADPQVKSTNIELSSTAGSSNPGSWMHVLRDRVEPGLPTIEVTRDGAMHQGHGILFTDQGHILTSAGLVTSASHTIVWFGDQRHEAQVLGTDQLTDVAVIQIADHNHPPATLGLTHQTQVGQHALSLGDHGGLNTGVIEDLAAAVELDAGRNFYGLLGMKTSADLAPGSPVFDDTGVIIAMAPSLPPKAPANQYHPTSNQPTLGVPDTPLIPITLVQRIAAELLAVGKVQHAWLGVAATNAFPTDTDSFASLGSDATTGAVIVDLVNQGPAAKALLRVDDVIVQIGDSPVRSMADLVLSLRSHEPGARLKVHFVREERQFTTMITLGTRGD